MTATPHHGDEDKFAHFLRLIDPDLFPSRIGLANRRRDIRSDIFRLGEDCPWALRRLKEDLRDMDGQRLFPDRHAITVTFHLNAEEFALYKAVTAYINEFMPQQAGQRKHRRPRLPAPFSNAASPVRPAPSTNRSNAVSTSRKICWRNLKPCHQRSAPSVLPNSKAASPTRSRMKTTLTMPTATC